MVCCVLRRSPVANPGPRSNPLKQPWLNSRAARQCGRRATCGFQSSSARRAHQATQAAHKSANHNARKPCRQHRAVVGTGELVWRCRRELVVIGGNWGNWRTPGQPAPPPDDAEHTRIVVAPARQQPLPMLARRELERDQQTLYNSRRETARPPLASLAASGPENVLEFYMSRLLPSRCP